MPCPLISRRLKLATGEISTVGRPTSEGRQFVAAKEATVGKDLFTVWGPSSGASPGPAPLGQVLTLWAKCEAAMGCCDIVIQSLDPEGWTDGFAEWEIAAREVT